MLRFYKGFLLTLLVFAMLLPHKTCAMDKREPTKLIELLKKGEQQDVLCYLSTCNLDEINKKDHETGSTALQLAARRGYVEVMRVLLEKGAKVNEKNEGVDWTALHYAFTFAPEEFIGAIVTLLLKNGADPNISDIVGTTPFVQACEKRKYKVVDLFFNKTITSFKPDLTKKRLTGLPPLIDILTSDAPPPKIVKLLLKNGAHTGILHVAGKEYALADWVKIFRPQKKFPNYQTETIANCLTVALLKRELEWKIKKNSPGVQLESLAQRLRAADKKYYKSFLMLAYFQNQFENTCAKLCYIFDPPYSNGIIATVAEELQIRTTKNNPIIKPDIQIHFRKTCRCLSCRKFRRTRPTMHQKKLPDTPFKIELMEIKN